jgi:hypothetical protein
MPVFSIFHVEKPTALLSFSNVKEQTNYITPWRKNPKVHHSTHNSPPPVPVLRHHEKKTEIMFAIVTLDMALKEKERKCGENRTWTTYATMLPTDQSYSA